MTDLSLPADLFERAESAVVVEPDDILVLVFPENINLEQFKQISNAIGDKAGKLAGRVLIVAGAKQALVARGAASEASDG